jgi:hypothetical protein
MNNEMLLLFLSLFHHHFQRNVLHSSLNSAIEILTFLQSNAESEWWSSKTCIFGEFCVKKT